MQKNKWIDLIAMFLFGAFAMVQFNDSDAILWIVLYLSVVLLALLAFRANDKFNQKLSMFSKIHLIAMLCLTVFYGVEYNNSRGAANGSFMDPGQETLREIMGIVLCVIASFYYSKRFSTQSG